MSNDPMMSDEFESETFRPAEDTSKRSESTLTQPEEADGSRDDEAVYSSTRKRRVKRDSRAYWVVCYEEKRE